VAAVLAQEYDLQLPNFTVGAKRKQEAAPEPFLAYERAERALAQAEDQLKNAEHFSKRLGPQPPTRVPRGLAPMTVAPGRRSGCSIARLTSAAWLGSTS
jgi:hypothetical protein